MGKLGRMPSRFGDQAPAGQRLSATFADRYEARETLEPWRRWYKTARWQRLADAVKVAALFTCGRCGCVCAGKGEAVADHRIPHRGDPALFWDRENLWCLCASCHSSAKQAEERAGQ